MIEKNRAVTICLNPFRLFMKVRSSCVLIIIINGVIIELAREVDVQKIN